MQKRRIRAVVCLLLCCAMLSGCVRSAAAEALQADRALAAQYGCKRGEVLRQNALSAGSAAADWLALTLRCADIRESYDEYLDALRQYVTDAYAEKGRLDASRATEYHRIALTVRMLGADPTAFGSKPDGSAADLVTDGVLHFADLSAQGINAVAYALLTLDACAPENTQTQSMRQTLLQTLLAAQHEDGGFGLTAAESDTDLTAIVLQSLAPYAAQYADAVSRAVQLLADRITPRGTYTFFDVDTAESTAQVLLSLCALGIDPAADPRFASLPDGLLSFRTADGLYRHTDADAPQLLPTQQCLLARIALSRLQSGQTWIFDFSEGA